MKSASSKSLCVYLQRSDISVEVLLRVEVVLCQVDSCRFRPSLQARSPSIGSSCLKEREKKKMGLKNVQKFKRFFLDMGVAVFVLLYTHICYLSFFFHVRL